MASFPDIDSQDVLSYAYGTAPHAPHLQPGWVDSQAPSPASVRPEQGSSVPSGGDVSTQPLYLPHEFDDSTAPSHASNSVSDRTHSQSRSYATTSGSGTGTGSSYSIPHLRAGAHIDYTSSESGGSFGSAAFSVGATSDTAAVGGGGWTLETNATTRTIASADEQDNRLGGGADNEAAQSEHGLAGTRVLENVKSGEMDITRDGEMIGAHLPHGGGMERDTYMHATGAPGAGAGLLPPFEPGSAAYIIPPPFTLSGLKHDLPPELPPSTRATATTVVRSAASGILTPVSEAHSTTEKHDRSSPLPAIAEVEEDESSAARSHEQPSLAGPMAVVRGSRSLSRPHTPTSTKDEVPETPPAHSPSPSTEYPSAELGDPPPPRIASRPPVSEHKFLPRKGEKAPSPVPPSRESSFGLMSPKTRYLDEKEKRDREEGRRTRGGGGRKKSSVDDDREEQRGGKKGKKPVSSASEKKRSKRTPTPASPGVESPQPHQVELEAEAPNTVPTQQSTNISSVVRRTFAQIAPPALTLAGLPEGADAEAPRTGTTGTGAYFQDVMVGSGQRILVETSSSAPLVEEPEQEEEEEEVLEESGRAEPGSSERRVSMSTPSRGTRETRWSSKDSKKSAPASQARAIAEAIRAARAEPAPSHEQNENGRAVEINGTQELASPSQKQAPVTPPPRERAKRARQPSGSEEQGPAKRRKEGTREPTTPNKAKEATKVYSAKKKRRSGDLDEGEPEHGEEDQLECAKKVSSKPASRAEPPQPVVRPASKGTKRKAEKAPSDADSAVVKRPKRGAAQKEREPSEAASAVSQPLRRGRSHIETDDGEDAEPIASATTTRGKKKAPAKKVARAPARKAIQEAEEVRDPAPQRSTAPESEVQLEVAEDEPTPSPVVCAGAPFSRVFAIWSADKCYYPATVTSQVSSGRKAGQFNVDFDDGSTDCLPSGSLRAAVLKEGDTIAVQKDRRWREARVMEGAFGTVQKDTLVRIRSDEASQSVEQVFVKVLRIPKLAVPEWDDRKLIAGQITAQVIVKREGEDKRTRSNTVGPGGGSVSESPAPGPSQRRRLVRTTSSILEGHAFVITAKEEKIKQELVRQIEINSGEVAEDLGEFFEVREGRIIWKGAARGITAVWCIAREVSTTPKYLMALALGVPCLGYRFIYDVVEQKMGVESWPSYLLAAGKSNYHGSDCSQRVDWRWGKDGEEGQLLMSDIMSSPHICRPLRSKRVLCIVSKKESLLTGTFLNALWAMGADHVEKTSSFSPDEDLDSFDFLYWPDKGTRITIDKTKKVKVVGAEWVKQCLFAGLCVPVE